MLQLTQRHTGQQFLPTGEFNPCADPAGVCLVATNIRTDVSPSAASEARLASGLIGGSFVGGTGIDAGQGIAADTAGAHERDPRVRDGHVEFVPGLVQVR